MSAILGFSLCVLGALRGFSITAESAKSAKIIREWHELARINLVWLLIRAIGVIRGFPLCGLSALCGFFITAESAEYAKIIREWHELARKNLV